MTDTLSPERVAEIRALAEKATPGPWIRAGVRHKIGQESCFAVGPDVNPIAFLPIGSQQRDRFHAEAFKDAAYIAALDPQTVLALLASHEALRAEVERLREENAVARNTNGSQQNELIGLYDQLTTACTEAARRMRERCAGVARDRRDQWSSAGGFGGHSAAARIIGDEINALPLEES